VEHYDDVMMDHVLDLLDSPAAGVVASGSAPSGDGDLHEPEDLELDGSLDESSLRSPGASLPGSPGLFRRPPGHAKVYLLVLAVKRGPDGAERTVPRTLILRGRMLHLLEDYETHWLPWRLAAARGAVRVIGLLILSRDLEKNIKFYFCPSWNTKKKKKRKKQLSYVAHGQLPISLFFFFFFSNHCSHENF
jgi:hypothetical protein